jgi:hypothetical protein
LSREFSSSSSSHHLNTKGLGGWYREKVRREKEKKSHHIPDGHRLTSRWVSLANSLLALSMKAAFQWG